MIPKRGSNFEKIEGFDFNILDRKVLMVLEYGE